jgi:hypothetical protein
MTIAAAAAPAAAVAREIAALRFILASRTLR